MIFCSFRKLTSDSIQFIVYDIALARFLFVTSEMSQSYTYIVFSFFYMQLIQDN